MRNLPKREGVFTIYDFEGGKLRFNRRIFQASFILLVLLFLGAWAIDGFGNPLLMNFKIECQSKTACDNPFYQVYKYEGVVPTNIINMEQLPAGFKYDKGNFLADYYIELMVLILVSCFVIEHLLYNRGFRWKKTFKAEAETIKNNLNEIEVK